MTPSAWITNRRQLLKTAVVGVSAFSLTKFLVACADDSTDSDSASNDSGSGQLDGPISTDMALVQRWVPDQLTPGLVRLPISLADKAGLLMTGPAVLTGKIINYLDDSVVAEGLTAQRRWLGEGTAPFWTFNANVPDVSTYALVVEGGPSDGAAFQIFDSKSLVVVSAGDVLPALETPTVDDHRGVEPYCTRLPAPCPLHSTTLAQALTRGQRVVFLVGTPAHCQTGVCAPVLDELIELAQEFTAVIFVHADVYADDSATDLAPAVTDLQLTFEPVLWVTNTDGVITQRFEGVWHVDEVRAVLI